MVQQWYLNNARFTRVAVDTFYSLFPFLPNDLLPAVVLPAPPTSASRPIDSDLFTPLYIMAKNKFARETLFLVRYDRGSTTHANVGA
jgi:hypothetical protein